VAGKKNPYRKQQRLPYPYLDAGEVQACLGVYKKTLPQLIDRELAPTAVLIFDESRYEHYIKHKKTFAIALAEILRNRETTIYTQFLQYVRIGSSFPFTRPSSTQAKLLRFLEEITIYGWDASEIALLLRTIYELPRSDVARRECVRQIERDRKSRFPIVNRQPARLKLLLAKRRRKSHESSRRD